jgi:hypothetical protein
MDQQQLKTLAGELLEGQISIEQFVRRMTTPATVNLNESRVDLDRASRCGLPEVIYGEGKSLSALQRITATLREHGHEVLLTRLSSEKAAAISAHHSNCVHNACAKTLRIGVGSNSDSKSWASLGRVCVVSAGTSDLPVAEEAKETALWTGVTVDTIYDVGVAGPHRLTEELDTLRTADAIVVVAGMEAALASVVGGHVSSPVIAVPTSVGYGASLGGMAALLSVLNSCASNVTVVNIDAGFKGGYVAGVIARQLGKLRKEA